MSRERIGLGPIESAQIFFENLYREMSGGPLADDLETARRMLAINECFDSLVLGGKVLPDGSTEAEYEALIGSHSVSILEGAVVAEKLNDISSTCTIKYAKDGFAMEGTEDKLKWLASTKLAGQDNTTIYSTVTGQIGHLDTGIFVPEPEHARGLVIVANNMATIFWPGTFLQRLY